VSVIPHETLLSLRETAATTPPGDIVEVGVYRGGSASVLAEVSRSKGCRLHLFDTFLGMPFAGADDKHQVGDFGDTSLRAVSELVPDALIYPGVFPSTLPATWTEPFLAFVHCDVDQYESTRSVIEHLWPMLVPGGVMWFDDCELAPAMRAIEEMLPGVELLDAPGGRRWAKRD
jgi:hypothetical protein